MKVDAMKIGSIVHSSQSSLIYFLKKILDMLSMVILWNITVINCITINKYLNLFDKSFIYFNKVNTGGS